MYVTRCDEEDAYKELRVIFVITDKEVVIYRTYYYVNKSLQLIQETSKSASDSLLLGPKKI